MVSGASSTISGIARIWVRSCFDGVDHVTGGAADDVRGDGLGEVGVGPVRPLLGQVRR